MMFEAIAAEAQIESDHLLELVTRWAVVVGYGVAILTAAHALVRTKLWARKLSAVAIMIGSGYFLFFYLYLIFRNEVGDTVPALYSRFGHYLMALALITMALSIGSAEEFARRARRKLAFDLSHIEPLDET